MVEKKNEMTDSQMESLKYQLDLLKMEVQSIDKISDRMDEITQTTKNWTIVTWAGSITLALHEPSLRPYIAFTSVLPLLFWYIDVHWRHLHGRSIFRMTKIYEFLNDGRLVESFKQKKMIHFTVLDPTGRQYINDANYKKATSILRANKYAEIGVLYFVLILISLVVGILFSSQ
jgi:hypothetical protein